MYDFLDKIGLKAVLEAIKGKIPASLPANGGNADTLSSKSIDYFMHWRNETIVNPDDVTNIGIYQWSTPTTNTIDPIAYGTLIVSNAFGYKCQIAIGVDTSVYIRHKTHDQEWSSWRNIADADTLDGLHAEKFMRYEPDKSLTTSINDMITAGTYGVYSVTPDFPTGYGDWGLLEVQVYGSICYQIIKFESGIIINRAKIVNQTEWTKWKEISTTPIKSTIISGTTDENGNMLLWAADNRKPLFFEHYDAYSIPFLSGDSKIYLSVHDANTKEKITNAPMVGTLYYVEM